MVWTRPCQNLQDRRCTPEEWVDFLRQIESLPIDEKLERVNTLVNAIPYLLDPTAWDEEDFWATPFEMIWKEGGDCEDYTIAKYMLLKESGVPEESMHIVVVNDLVNHVAHAVLEVEISGVSYILDNQRERVILATLVQRYQPVYSVNNTGWWLYRNRH